MQLTAAVRDADGYPAHVARSRRDFLVSRDGLAAWVVERADSIVGRVALHSRSADAVVALATERLGQPADRLGVVGRLLMAPDARRQGLGQTLLHTAAKQAHARGLWPILDVVTTHRAVIRLYEACGWLRAGAVTLTLRDGAELEEFVYFGPRPGWA